MNGDAVAAAPSSGKQILSALQGMERRRRIVLSFPEPVDGGAGDQGRPYDPIKVTVGCIELNEPSRGEISEIGLYCIFSSSYNTPMPPPSTFHIPHHTTPHHYTFLMVSFSPDLPTSNCVSEGSAGTFEIVAPAAGSDGLEFFSVEPTKGAPKPGDTTEISFTFKPPQADLDPACVVVGQWKEVVYQCILSGGFVPEGEDDKEIVDVVVRGFVTS